MDKILLNNKERELTIKAEYLGREIELLAAYKTVANPQAIALICHPDPTAGGNLNNKVVTAIQKSLPHDVATLRFNYGISDKNVKQTDTKQEIIDAKIAVNFLIKQHPNTQIWLCGFSFGGYICTVIANDYHDVTKVLLVAPAVTRLKEDVIMQISPIIIQPQNDEIIPVQLVKQFAQLNKAKYIEIEDGTHLLHGKLNILKDLIIENL